MAKKKKRKVSIAGNLPVNFIKEDNMFIAYTPVLDLSTCGKTFDEAMQNFNEALCIFFTECTVRGTLNQALESCGWQKKTRKKKSNWEPPMVVANNNISLDDVLVSA